MSAVPIGLHAPSQIHRIRQCPCGVAGHHRRRKYGGQLHALGRILDRHGGHACESRKLAGDRIAVRERAD
jgi:hypothetical protein